MNQTERITVVAALLVAQGNSVADAIAKARSSVGEVEAALAVPGTTNPEWGTAEWGGGA